MNRCAFKLKIQCHLQLLKKKKKRKYLSVNLTKHLQNFYAKNHKTMLKEINEKKKEINDLNIWRHSVFMDWKVQHN